MAAHRSARAPLATLAAAATLLGALPAAAAAQGSASPARASERFLDVRLGLPPRAATTAAVARAASTRRSLGRQAVVQVDPMTGTVRQLQRLDGALTGPSGAAPAAIARAYARAHAAALGLDRADVDALHLADEVHSATGLTVVRFGQQVGGVPAFDNDVRVGIDRAGRVITVSGSPRDDLSGAIGTTPALSADQALDALMAQTGVRRAVSVTSRSSGARRTTRFSTGDTARLVLFGARRVHLGWHLTYRADSSRWFDAVVDAATGEILYRANLVKSAAAVFEYYPGAPLGGVQTVPDPLVESYLAPGATTMSGPNVHAWADTNDDDAPNPNEEVAPGDYPFTDGGGSSSGCNATPGPRCTWDHTSPASWVPNKEQNVVQTFWYANRFHDHLASGPINFTPSSGNMQGDDPLLLNALDGAATGSGGGPDKDHISNANMATPADGQSPRMQMFLFGNPPFRDIDGGDSAAVLYHEYTHGLSSRLVTNSDGTQALNSPHAGAMGEGWSDWYAEDFLARPRPRPNLPQVFDPPFVNDTPADGDVEMGRYTDVTPHSLRPQALDCAVGSTSPACPSAGSAGAGGFTFGDLGKIAGSAEVHDDGMIWSQTLWQLRRGLVARYGDIEGSNAAERIFTDAMRLSIPEPSFLDMRNAILAADGNDHQGVNRDLIWEVFRSRGMGYYAVATDGSDVSVTEDFSPPPGPDTPTGAVSGTITSANSGLPLQGATAGIGGLNTKPEFQPFLAATSDAAGRYTIGGVPQGSYPKLVFEAGGGYDQLTQPVVVGAGDTITAHAQLRRDWAASAGGGRAVETNDDTGAQYGCGAAAVIDQSQGAGWSAENRPNDPPTVTIRLPQAITVDQFALDPANTCGDGPSSATRDYVLETSPDKQTWRTAVNGHFAMADRGRLNLVAPAAAAADNVRYVRLTLHAPQSSALGGSGAEFIDFSELEVLGNPPNALPSGSLTATPGTVGPGQVVTLDASSFTDPDSAITGYDWDLDGDGTIDRTTAGPTTDFAYGGPGTFAPKVAARDFRGGAGGAAATVVVTGAPAKPVKARPSFVLPRTGTKGRVRFKVTCKDRCRLSGTLTVDRTTRRRIKSRTTTVARLAARTISGKRTVTISLSRTARSLLRKAHAQRLPVGLRVTATVLDGGPKRSIARRITLRL